MQAPERIGREKWLHDLVSGRLDFEISFSGYGTYGTPGSPWGGRNRLVESALCYLFLDGGIRISWAGKMAEITEGGLFLLAPNVQHDFELLSPERSITVYHFRLLTRFRKRVCWMKEDFLCFRHMLPLRPYFEEIFEEIPSNLPHKKERIRSLLFLSFLSAFRSEQKRTGKGLTFNQQARLTRFVLENRGRQPGPAELAATLNLSHDYFSRLFKETYGVIPRVWLVQERLRLASLELAETRKSIGSVAEGLGYRNAFLFSHQFSRQFGCSPREFRRKHCRDIRP